MIPQANKHLHEISHIAEIPTDVVEIPTELLERTNREVSIVEQCALVGKLDFTNGLLCQTHELTI
jgi:hypothetical protein